MEAPGTAQHQRKLEKENFVSFLEGTTFAEVAWEVSTVPVLILVCQLLKCALGPAKTPSTVRGKVASLALEWLLVVVPTILTMTLLADSIPWVFASAAAAAVPLAALRTSRGKDSPEASSGAPQPQAQPQPQPQPQRLLYLSNFRATVMLTTCLSILAVDFRAFPRRFAKTENFGTGMMDIGVGSFVVINGISSHHARGASKPWHHTLRSLSPLLILGFGRLLAVKGLDYQEHVGEYGVHWNFFFTVAAVALLSSLLPPRLLSTPAGLLILTVHQSILSLTPLGPLVHQQQRDPSSLLSLNKEGLLSIPGYLALYVLSVSMGRYLRSLDSAPQMDRGPKEASWVAAAPTSPKDSSAEGASQPGRIPSQPGRFPRQPGLAWARLAALLGALWGCTLLLDATVERVSRRSCNAAYVLWLLSLCLQVMLLFRFFEKVPSLARAQLRLMRLLDQNLLPTFLIANLCTGLVNMSMDTLAVPDLYAVGILMAYSLLFISPVFYFQDILGVRLKFW